MIAYVGDGQGVRVMNMTWGDSYVVMCRLADLCERLGLGGEPWTFTNSDTYLATGEPVPELTWILQPDPRGRGDDRRRGVVRQAVTLVMSEQRRRRG